MRRLQQPAREGSAYGNSTLTQKPRVVGSYRAAVIVSWEVLNTEKYSVKFNVQH